MSVSPSHPAAVDVVMRFPFVLSVVSAAFIEFDGHRYDLDPATQNTPIRLTDQHLRPPPPRLPSVFDIFIGISSYRDGVRCGFTLFTAFSRATHPDRVYVGVVDQVLPTDATCLDEYCKLATSHWGECKFKSHITIDSHDALTSTGPTGARHAQQQLIGDEEFCLELDAHSQLITAWDTKLVKEWVRTNNEMAVLSTYPMGFEYMHAQDLTFRDSISTHLCRHMHRSSADAIPYTKGSSIIHDSEWPQMAVYFGGGLSFSKCHAEKRAVVDANMKWLFYGEEYLRTMALWTHGYDIYSPNTPPAALNAKYDQEQQTYNRLKNILKLPFQGYVDMTDVASYSYGLVRSVDQFIEFSGISPTNAELDTHRCNQLHWVPYARPEVVEAWVPGYHMHPLAPADISPSQAAMNNKQVQALMDLLVNATSSTSTTHDLVAAGKQAIADGLSQQKANVDELLKQVAALTSLSNEWKQVKNAVVQDKEQRWTELLLNQDLLKKMETQLKQLTEARKKDSSVVEMFLPGFGIAGLVVVVLLFVLVQTRRGRTQYHQVPTTQSSLE
ncbi:hypothetical protein B5M09_013165 [Aphanomyces astaci]|uniref:Uncharacterized protein n=1 Tax=Aphanomyces astaci TaxID=112090 RepID=A0A3R7ZMI5_APHAT|nr:hypothetical protein B5M09_013165 [Aphanomyces astaci]